MARRLKPGNVILCDHAIIGQGNKHSLIGVFSGDLLIESFPANLSFGLFVELLDTGPSLPAVTISLQLGDKAFGRLTANFGGTLEEGAPGVVVIPLVTIGVDQPTTLEVTAKAEGYATTILLKKKILKATSPSALPPPSSRFPPDAPAS